MSHEKTSYCGLVRGRSVLIASLAINVFMLGAFASPLMHHFFMPPPFAGDMQGRPHVEGIFQVLSKDDATKLRAILDDVTRAMEPRREDIAQSSQRLAEILRQDKPDMAALQKELDAMEGMGRGFHQNMSAVIKRIATEFSPETRCKIADSIARGRFGLAFRGKGPLSRMNNPDLRGPDLPPPAEAGPLGPEAHGAEEPFKNPSP